MGGSIDLNQLDVDAILAGVENIMDEHQGDPTVINNTNYPGVTCSSDGVADTFGAWVEVIADIGSSAVILTESIIYLLDVAFPTFEMEVGIGAAASEVAVARTIGKLDISALSLLKTPIVSRLNRRIPANSRIAVRIKDSIATSVDYTAMLKWKPV